MESVNVQTRFALVLFCRDPQGGELSMEVKTSLLRFRLKQKRATIDVWWLYDDGGLSMLLPHILTTRANWSNSKLRVFCLIDEKKEHQSEIKKYAVATFDNELCINVLFYYRM